MRQRWVLGLMLMSLIGVGMIGGISAQGTPRGLPSNFTQVVYASGFNSATSMAFAPDGRLFVTQQGGLVRVVPAGGGSILSPAFVTLNVNNSGERGILGIAFHPNFVSNHYVYIYYTPDVSPLRNRLSRFTANGNVAEAGSEEILVEFDNLSSATNHNGGAIHFGADGKLYVAIGDNANSANAQSLTTRHGKILRYNPNGSIPTDNPFYATTSGANQAIWALGLRNPYTFDVQSGTGMIFINDVGQNMWEEINEGAAGANYGWPSTEGDFNQASFPNFTRPRYAYNHDNGECAITGGAFYNPQTPVYPAAYIGDYFFTDYCGGWIKRYDPTTGQVNNFGSALAASLIVDLEIGADGKLYAMSRGNGNVYRYDYNAVEPTLTPTVQPTVGSTPPVPVIVSPLNGANYRGGQTITVQGTATDAEDGNLKARAFTWQVDFHHADHVHPFIAAFSGTKNMTVVIPKRGTDNSATNVFYRITLTVIDSTGQQVSTFVDVLPEVVTTTVNSVPDGLTVLLDGQPLVTPFSFDTVADVGRSLSAPLTQAAYTFDSWTTPDGNLPVPDWTIFPSADQTLTVMYVDGAQTNLLSNGTFESLAGGTPPALLNWARPANVVPSRAKQVCDVSGNSSGERLVSFEGVCAAQLKGSSTQPTSKLTQVINPVITAGMEAGDIVTLVACASGINIQGYTMNALKVTYSGGGGDKLTLTWPDGTFDWMCQRADLSLTGQPSKIQAILVYPKATGRIRFDALGVWLTE